MKNKILSIALSITIIFSMIPVISFAAVQGIEYENFDDLENLSGDWNVSQTGDCVCIKDTDKGKSLACSLNSGESLKLSRIFSNTDSSTPSVSFGFSINKDEFSNVAVLLGGDNEVLTVNSLGEVTAAGNQICNIENNIWNDFSIVLNLITGDMTLKYNNEFSSDSFAVKGVTSNVETINSLDFNMENGDTLLDEIRLFPLTYDFKPYFNMSYKNNFENFKPTSNGLGLPDDSWTMYNSSEGATIISSAEKTKEFGKSMKIYSDGTKHLEVLKIISDYHGKVVVDFDIMLDSISNIKFGIKGVDTVGIYKSDTFPIAIAGDGTIWIGAQKPGVVDAGKWYHCNIVFDTDKLMYTANFVDEYGTVYSGSNPIPNNIVLFHCFEFYTPVGTPASFYVDNISCGFSNNDAVSQVFPKTGFVKKKTDTVNAFLTDNPDAATANNITALINNSNELISSIDVKNNVVTVKLNKTLENDKLYDLNISGITIDGVNYCVNEVYYPKTTVTVSDFKFLNSVTKRSAEAMARVYTDSEEDDTACMVVIVKDSKTGMIVNEKSSEITMTSSPQMLYVEADIPNDEKQYDAYAYIVKKINNPVLLTDGISKQFDGELGENLDEEKVNFKSKINTNKKTKGIVLILNPNVEFDEIDFLTDNNFLNTVSDFCEVETNEKGEFETDMYLPQKSGQFSAWVFYDNKIKYFNKAFMFVSKQFKEDVLNKTNSNDDDISRYVIDNINCILDNNKLYSKLGKDEIIEAVSYAISDKFTNVNNKFSTYDEFKISLMRSLIMINLCADISESQKDDMLVDGINECGLNEFSPIVNYSEIKDKSNRTNLLHKAINDCEACFIDEFYDKLSERILIEKIKNVINHTELTDILLKNEEYIGLDLTEYKKIKDKKDINIYIHQSLPNTIEELCKVIKKGVAEIKDKTKDKFVGGSGGGGKKSLVTGASQSFSADTSNNNENKHIYFSDLKGYEWAQEAIINLAEQGKINGVGNNMFAPSKIITREEFVTMLVNAIFDKPEYNSVINFNDVKIDDWYFKYIATAYSNGLVNGITKDVFGIGNYITRQDMAVMTYRFALFAGVSFRDSHTFEDSNSISDYAKESVELLAGIGLCNGVGNNAFAPMANCNRAQAAVMINNLINYLNGDETK